MSIKLAVLKSGEKIISDIKEGISEDKVITYILFQPCVIFVGERCKVLSDEDSGNFQNKIKISLSKWPQFSVDNTVLIPSDYVATIVEPDKDLKEMYTERVLQDGKKISKDDSIDEPVNFTDSD